MFIDLDIPGDPASIYELAHYLDPKVSDAAHELNRAVGNTSGDSMVFWGGETGTVFRDALAQVMNASEPVSSYASSAAEVFRAYARRLERGREEFDDYASEAGRHWCYLSENKIIPPDRPIPSMHPVGQAPPPSSEVSYQFGSFTICVAEPLVPGWYGQAIEWFDRVANAVGEWWGELGNWMDEHMAPLIESAEDFDALSKAIAAMGHTTDVARGFSLNLAEANWQDSLAYLETRAKDAQAEAATHSRRLRSGHPGVRAAAQRVTKADLLAARRVLDYEVHRVRVGARLLPVAGVGVDLIAAGAEVAAGGSASTAVAGVLGGIGSGAVAAAIIATAPVSVPTIVAAGGVVLVGWAGSEGAKWAWENSVSLDVREALDARDFGYVID